MGRPSREDEKGWSGPIHLKGISRVFQVYLEGIAGFSHRLQKTRPHSVLPFEALVSLGLGANGSGTDWFDAFVWEFQEGFSRVSGGFPGGPEVFLSSTFSATTKNPPRSG